MTNPSLLIRARRYWLDHPWHASALLFTAIVLLFCCGYLDIHVFPGKVDACIFIALAIAAIALLLVLCCLGNQLLRSAWKNALTVVLAQVFNAIAAIYLFMMLFLIAQGEPDLFAKNLKIPANLPISAPLGVRQVDSIIARHPSKPDLLLAGSVMQQGGRYQFAFLYPRIAKGYIYLKAFEVTHNTPLSADALRKETMLLVDNPTDEVRSFSKENVFTIYEGDFKQYYAARFEVWYLPVQGGGGRAGCKLFDKNFKVEGWQR